MMDVLPIPYPPAEIVERQTRSSSRMTGIYRSVGNGGDTTRQSVQWLSARIATASTQAAKAQAEFRSSVKDTEMKFDYSRAVYTKLAVAVALILFGLATFVVSLIPHFEVLSFAAGAAVALGCLFGASGSEKARRERIGH